MRRALVSKRSYKTVLISAFFCAEAVISPLHASQSPPHVDTSGINLAPPYPASASISAERGAVLLQVHVNANGTVEFIRPLLTSGFADLDRAAVSGVMSWHFVPAISDGKNAEGDALVQIEFTPPSGAEQAENVPGPAPKPAGDFLPQTLRIEANRGEFEKKTFPAVCANGKVAVTVQFLHAVGPAASDWKPAAALGVSGENGKSDQVSLLMSEVEYISPPEQSLELRHGADFRVGFMRAHLYGSPETLTLSWDSSGLVTATVGSMETHQARLSGAPTTLYFTSSSGAAEFKQPMLICTPP